MKELIAPSTADLCTKSNIQVLADQLATPVLEGEEEPIETYAKIRFMEAVLAEAKSKIEEAVSTRLTRQSGRGGFGSIELQAVNGGRQYSYAHDSEWERLDKLKNEREELMKKAAGTEGIVVGDEVVPPAKITYKKDSIKVTIL